ncbi:unnamed protein product [Oppiella nova]|uniref:Uncharacterized protein n=1 Tax=Oppiella nova TaxID=334625 RepID=A0A7R9QUC1_9ACAR|nr:unnamed protein product [Oppiella nova]CAG2175946.1 unnamed protein product [Oppiella nova]
MGSIIAIPIILGTTRLVKSVYRVNRQINGQWFRRQNKSNRIVRHDVWSDGIRDAGILPFPHEWDYDLPQKF